MTPTIRGALTLAVALVAGCGRSLPPVERVVLITVDTIRADRVGCYGYAAATTPEIDRLAAESVLYEQAVASAPTTLPSHATILTGLDPPRHGVRYNITFRLDDGIDTLAERLRGAGFATGAFVSSLVLSREFGLAQGFDAWDEPAGDGTSANPLGVERRAAESVDRALAWLQRAPARSFAWIHLYDPHWPYEPPFPHSARHADDPYDGEIAYADHQIGRVLSLLREAPSWDRTLVVVAGDHGEGLHDHGERFHSLLAYETSLRVPLIIRAPRARASRVAEPVGLVDLVPTVLDLAGMGVPADLDGRSLRPSLEGAAPERREVYFETLAGALNYGWSPLSGVRRGPWKLIRSSDPELFDLESDPHERVNRIGLDAQRAADLGAALEAIEARAQSSGAAPAADPGLEPELAAKLASLGYVSGGLREATAVEGPSPRALVDLETELLRAQGAAAAEEWPRLDEVCRYVLSRDPGNRFALSGRALALTRLGRSREAEPFARDLVRRYPTAGSHHDLLGQVLVASGRPAEAREAFLAGIEAGGDPESLTYHALLATFEFDRATVCGVELPRAVSSHPTSARLAVLEARCDVIAGRQAAAIDALARATRLGFGDFEMLEEVPEFRSIVRLPAFGRLREAARKTAPQGPSRPSGGLTGS